MIHPLAVVFARQQIRQELRKNGVGFLQAIESSRNVTGDDLDDTAAAVGAALPAAMLIPDAGTVGAIGDGTILQAIIDFFKSPTGQMILGVIIKAILAALGL